MIDCTNMDEVEIEIAKLEKYIKFARLSGGCIGISIVIYGSYFFNTLENQMPLMLIAIFLVWALMLSSFYYQNKLKKLENEVEKIKLLNIQKYIQANM
jgi:purine-cytosine permease-like protein